MTTKKPTIKKAVMEIIKKRFRQNEDIEVYLDLDKASDEITNLFKERLEGLKGKEFKKEDKRIYADGYNVAIREFNQKIDDLIKELE